MNVIWSGPKESPGRFDKERISDLIRECLSRSQLKDLVLLRRANSAVDFSKLVAIVSILEDDYNHSKSLRQYGLSPPDRVSYAEETQFSRMDRVELEQLVLDFI